jgi:hypothetical protein
MKPLPGQTSRQAHRWQAYVAGLFVASALPIA